MSFILDADIRSFFDEINQQWLIRFLEHRIGDRRIIRLIQKWLKAGILEDGVVSVSDRGTGQGSVISPLLANIYLHYALDLWAVRWRRREATGDMIIVRYADDFIVGFQHESDARRFLDEMRERLEKFALSLHPEKTRLIEFGRFAAERRKRCGLGKPETFNFLGFTFICGKTRAGKFQIRTEDPTRPHAGEAQDDQGGDVAAHAPADPRPGEVAAPCRPAATSTITPCRPMLRHWSRSGITSPISGGARCGVAARRIGCTWARMTSWRTTGFPNRSSFILGRAIALPSHTRGGSRMRESRPYGSVRGAR